LADATGGRPEAVVSNNAAAQQPTPSLLAPWVKTTPLGVALQKPPKATPGVLKLADDPIESSVELPYTDATVEPERAAQPFMGQY
jgi:hypothetical protein